MTLSLLIVTIIASVTPTRANSQSTDTKFIGALGEVNLQLPSNSSPPAIPGGVANHPTTLKIGAWDLNSRSTLGAADELLIFIWSPVQNRLADVAVITDNADNAAFWKTVWNNSYIWYPTTLPPQAGGPNLFPNVILVEPNELEVWTESGSSSGGNGHWGWDNYGRYVWQTTGGGTFWVNLTKSVKVTLPYFNATGTNTNQTFTLPPFSLMFKTTSDPFDGYFTVTLKNYRGASNYTLVRTGTTQFAGVRANIPDWLGSSFRYEDTGHVYWHVTDTWTPPP